MFCNGTTGYTEAVNNLFKLRSFSPPANLSNPKNMMAILLNNMYGKRISRGNVLYLTAKSLPSCIERQ